MNCSVILDNLEQIRYRVSAAAARAGRNSNEIRLIAVTKYAALQDIKVLLQSGAVAEVGESRIQDAQAKKQELGALAQTVRWRFIGHLQTNKAKKAAQTFDAVDSIDKVETAEALEKALAPLGKRLPVLVQVKLTGRESQSGVAPDALESLLESLRAYPRLDARGLMAIAPDLSPVEAVRPHFRKLHQLFNKFFSNRPDAELSMGMSRDFEIAVEEGATHIRVGSALFS